MEPPKSSKIVVFGSVVQDLISYTDRFPKPGESIRGNAFFAGSGGKGANQAVASAKLGADVHLIAKVGDDMFGEMNLKNLTKEGVNVDAVTKSENSQTATATITVDGEGENSIVVFLGANMEMTADVVEKNKELISSAGVVVAQSEVPREGNYEMFQYAKEHNVTTILNPAPADPKIDKRTFSLIDIICTNENEAEMITGIKQKDVETAKKAAEAMLEFGCKIVIITLGSKGIVTVSQDTPVEVIPVNKTKAVDTTGAGDCFVGSLAAFIARGIEWREAIKCAANLASLSVTRKGTQASYWNLEEIQMASTSANTDTVIEEDAAEIRFPKEFEVSNCDALLTSEVFLLLEHRRQQSEQKDDIEEMSEVFIKTLSYARRLSRFKNRETIRAVRAIFAEKNFHKFEVAQIANLCPESAEEAKALIPSLENKIEDAELDEILKEVQAKRTMGGWKLESARFLIMVGFPVGAFWLFNQPKIFKEFMKGYKVPDSSSGDKAIADFKEQLLAQKRKDEYESFLREQMAFEEAKKIRAQHGI
ncbi:unnamed protein product [Caenorhabditis auriculariae]|uniref:Ribokinase n=1 Tax=Caenorhabditis auriculariae TaxID=2777116 RepID=A0A8S1HP70_9PELO|nr:unnamed protein product [Caenorhabditis auriculariae]